MVILGGGGHRWPRRGLFSWTAGGVVWHCLRRHNACWCAGRSPRGPDNSTGKVFICTTNLTDACVAPAPGLRSAAQYRHDCGCRRFRQHRCCRQGAGRVSLVHISPGGWQALLPGCSSVWNLWWPSCLLLTCTRCIRPGKTPGASLTAAPAAAVLLLLLG